MISFCTLHVWVCVCLLCSLCLLIRGHLIIPECKEGSSQSRRILYYCLQMGLQESVNARRMKQLSEHRLKHTQAYSWCARTRLIDKLDNWCPRDPYIHYTSTRSTLVDAMLRKMCVVAAIVPGYSFRLGSAIRSEIATANQPTNTSDEMKYTTKAHGTSRQHNHNKSTKQFRTNVRFFLLRSY